MGRGSWVVGSGSWVVGRGSWVVGSGSWIRDPPCIHVIEYILLCCFKCPVATAVFSRDVFLACTLSDS